MFKLLIVGSVALVAAGCSSGSDSLNEMIGLSKDVPDERLVRTHQSLSMPPDLQLRAPSGETAETGSPNPYVQDANAAALNAPAAQTYAPAEPTYDAPSTQQVATQAPQPLDNQVASAPPADVYAQHGISRTNPDGSEKTDGQLTKELRAKIQEKKRAQNSNYGTVFNVGELFN